MIQPRKYSFPFRSLQGGNEIIPRARVDFNPGSPGRSPGSAELRINLFIQKEMPPPVSLISAVVLMFQTRKLGFSTVTSYISGLRSKGVKGYVFLVRY